MPTTAARPAGWRRAGWTQNTSHPGRGPVPSGPVVGRYRNCDVTGGSGVPPINISAYASGGNAGGGAGSAAKGRTAPAGGVRDTHATANGPALPKGTPTAARP